MRIELEAPNITFVQDIIDLKIKSVERAANNALDQRIKDVHTKIAQELRTTRNSINQIELPMKNK